MYIDFESDFPGFEEDSWFGWPAEIFCRSEKRGSKPIITTSAIYLPFRIYVFTDRVELSWRKSVMQNSVPNSQSGH